MVRVSCAIVEQKSDLKLKEKLSRIPGYSGPTLYEKVVNIIPEDTTYKNLHGLIKLKADLAEVRKL